MPHKLVPDANEARAYQLIINAIASGSEVQVTEDRVLIRSSELSVEDMESLFIKPTTFRNVVGKYVFVPEDRAATAEDLPGFNGGGLTHELTSRTKMPKQPDNFIRALFGDAILKELNLHDLDPAKLVEIDGNLVYPLENYAVTQDLWNARIDMLRKILQSAGAVGLEAAFSSGKPLQLNADGKSDPDLAKNIRDIIGIRFDASGDKPAILYLNKQYLTNLVFAPQVEVINAAGETPVIQIDKEQFAAYLARVFGSMVVPKQELMSDGNDAYSFVNTVVIPSTIRNSINKQNIYFFVIDVSLSLDDISSTYKQQLVDILRQFIATIKDSAGEHTNPEDLIRLAFFSDKSKYIDVKVSDALKSIAGLEEAIKTIEISGSTLLDGTVAEQIAAMLELASKGAGNSNINANMFVITDGQDNQSTDQQKKALQAYGDKFRSNEGLVPKFKIIRVMNNQQAVSRIDAISKGIDAEVLDITDVKGLARLFENIRDVNLRRELIEFVQDARRTVLAVHEGKLTVGPALDTTKAVKIGGSDYWIGEAPTHIADAMQMLAEQRVPLFVQEIPNQIAGVVPAGANDFLNNLGTNIGMGLAWGFGKFATTLAPTVAGLLSGMSTDNTVPTLPSSDGNAPQGPSI